MSAAPVNSARGSTAYGEVDFFEFSNTSFESVCATSVFTNTFSAKFKQNGHSKTYHYVLIPKDGAKKHINSAGAEFHGLAIIPLTPSHLRDPEIYETNQLAYVECDGNKRTLVADPEIMKTINNIVVISLRFDNNKDVIFSKRSTAKHPNGIKLDVEDIRVIRANYEQFLAHFLEKKVKGLL